MIDWLTIHEKFAPCFLDEWGVFCSQWPGWLRVGDWGEIVGTRLDWARLRSDSGEISVLPRGDGVTFAGSPAVAMGFPNNVFGPLCGVDAFIAMRAAGFQALRAKGWGHGQSCVAETRVSRIDVTYNVLVDSAETVSAVLASVGGIEAGRYRTTRKYGSSVYVGGKSRNFKAKLYSKGAHLRHLESKGRVTGVSLTDLDLCDRIVRLECEIGRDYLKDKDYFFVCEDLERLTVDYWTGLFGDERCEMVGDEFQQVLAVCRTEREAKAVYRTLLLIRSEGVEAAQVATARSTWFRHLSLLKRAGFGAVEVTGAGKVLRFPIREILGFRVDSWEELRRVAA